MNDKKPVKQVTIIINTEEHEVSDGDITYRELVTLAYPELAADDKQMFSVSYRRGPSKNEQGSLAEGGSVKVKNKMIFDVTPTTRS